MLISEANAVAELALGHMMCVARNLSFINRTIRSGLTISKADAGESGFQLRGKTLGLIGGGNIGQALGRMFARAFEGRIRVFDPYLGADAQTKWLQAIPTFSKVDRLDDLLVHSDIVSIHVPLLESTRGLIGARELALMKKSAILINTARGGIIDEMALADALNDGIILGAGIDAWEEEPPTLRHYQRLIQHPRVLST